MALKGISTYFEDSLANCIVESAVPPETLKNHGPCILGIDEAGRGPVLGPMVYAVAYYLARDESELKKMEFADSKTLSENQRERIFAGIGSNKCTKLGWIAEIMSPNMISNCMMRREKYNLNLMSHDTAIELIRKVQAKGVQVGHVYIDTVGPPDKYAIKIRSLFPGIKVTVANKADSLYPIVSAASICAKVIRDRIIKQWEFIEKDAVVIASHDRGSGYPADPITKKFLTSILDPIFGYPTLVRFSWSTITKLLEAAAPCDFNEPEEDDNQKSNNQKYTNQKKTGPTSKNNPSILSFFKKMDKKAPKTLPSIDGNSSTSISKVGIYLRDRQLNRIADDLI